MEWTAARLRRHLLEELLPYWAERGADRAHGGFWNRLDGAGLPLAEDAKRLGAHKVLALINRPAYAELVESGTIDIAISPQQITLGSLLAHVRRGDVVKVHSLRRGAAEAIEAVAHGNARASRVVGRTPLP